MKKPCSTSCCPGISWSAIRGTRPSGVPATSAPSGIQTIPRGGVGALALACHGGGPAARASSAATGRGVESRQASPASSASRRSASVERAPNARGPLWALGHEALRRVALIPLSQAELLHLELQPLPRDLEQARGVRHIP